MKTLLRALTREEFQFSHGLLARLLYRLVPLTHSPP